jgi:2-polyprenyl-3-methyl-5-hydroxy-6-metoxy-1,4-benzoquinol methylase
MLDVGCGEGRLGRFFSEKSLLASYCGVDFSEDLISIAKNQLPGNYFVRDFSTEGCLSDLGQFDVIACLATLQHVPASKRRNRLMVELASHMVDGGCIFLSTWQFLSSARQRRKIVEWPKVGISSNAVEDNDYLLSWSRDGSGLRYVCSIDSSEIRDMAHDAGLSVIHQFRSDGKEGDLNLYAILRNV